MKNKTISICFFCLLFLSACSQSEYAHLVNTEMKKDIRYDSIFLGLAFGQTRQQFFDICWQLNHDKVVTNGNSENMVTYYIPEKKDKRQKLLFYGIFDDKKITTGIRMKFTSDEWSLWNTAAQAEQVLPDVKEVLLQWFPGNDFQHIEVKGEKVWVKLDGNRRITIPVIKDNRYVNARISDMRYILESDTN